jgi:hypothetical protein
MEKLAFGSSGDSVALTQFKLGFTIVVEIS